MLGANAFLNTTYGLLHLLFTIDHRKGKDIMQKVKIESGENFEKFVCFCIIYLQALIVINRPEKENVMQL